MIDELELTQDQYCCLMEASSARINKQVFVYDAKTRKKLLKDGLMRQTVKSDLQESFWQVHPKCLILTEYGEKICSILWKIHRKENLLEDDIKVIIV